MKRLKLGEEEEMTRWPKWGEEEARVRGEWVVRVRRWRYMSDGRKRPEWGLKVMLLVMLKVSLLVEKLPHVTWNCNYSQTHIKKPQIIDQEAEKIVDFVSFHTINWENKFSWVEDDFSPASPVNEFYLSDK